MRIPFQFSLLFLLGLGTAQPLTPGRFRLGAAADTSYQRGLTSNAISEVRLQGDSLVWIGTSGGLSLLRDSLQVVTFLSGTGLQNAATTNLVPTGGVAALAVAGDTLVVALASSQDGDTQGQGLVFSPAATDSTITWTYFDQPVDAAGDSLTPFAKRFFWALPITVSKFNISYDAAIAGGYFWITSWAGGLRRYNLAEKSWERVPLPEDDQSELNTCDITSYETGADGSKILKDFYLNPRDPWGGVSTKSDQPHAYGHHNHKAFSVLAYGDTLWVGTAAGINRGILGANGCLDWKHYSYPADGLGGNFVVGLARQDWRGQRVIWAATVNRENPREQGLSYTFDDGLTWHTTLLGERVYNVIAVDSLVLAATERGLWKFSDDNPRDTHKTWALFKPARGAFPVPGTPVYDSDEVLSNEVLSVALESRPYYGSRPQLWIGTLDGLARSYDLHGSNWRIFRTAYDPAVVYAYPNPFSPRAHNLLDQAGYVRFHAVVKESYVIKMGVYNFAMENVYSEDFDRRNGVGTLKWNGRDNSGALVANGVYLIRLEYDNKVKWIKLIVIK